MMAEQLEQDMGMDGAKIIKHVMNKVRRAVGSVTVLQLWVECMHVCVCVWLCRCV